MLIVLGGLPGTGKTAIARELALRSPSVFLRIDTIEQALKKVNSLEQVGPAGYVVAYELARSNLALGMTVIADCVNPLLVTREAWQPAQPLTFSRLKSCAPTWPNTAGVWKAGELTFRTSLCQHGKPSSSMNTRSGPQPA